MRTAAVFCFPSLYEGFGLPALEAAACGTAVLCASGSSLPEVMGEAAQFVDPQCPESIAKGLLRVLQDEGYRAELAARGPVRAAAFTWSRCAHETLEAYRRAA
jgi:alpha-1,3-rhamnosyl/mannosyltransferase